jgi:sugar/nucleoside kinase (ribokinase family)
LKWKLTLKQLQQKFTLAEILVTNGSQGGYISSRNGQQTFYQAHPVDKVVDPTGAGDIFFAAYLAQRYHNRKSITFSLDHAALVTADYLEGKWDLSGGKITDVNKKTNYTQGE